jgi:organic hydroperoxide reductase OsmC/OhrA
LAIASMKKYRIATYEDNAVAILGKNEKRKMAVKTLYLRPNITFEGENIPDKTTIDEMHNRAHQECFIANSVLTEIIIEPAY